MLRELFEESAINHFGTHIKEVLTKFDEEDGYNDPIINAMWIGFYNAKTTYAEK